MKKIAASFRLFVTTAVCGLTFPLLGHAQITAEQAPLPKTQQLIIQAERAPLPGESEAKMRALLVVPKRQHSDSDFAYNMLQAMYDKALKANATLTKRAFILPYHDKTVAGDAEAGYYYGAARLSGFGVSTGPD